MIYVKLEHILVVHVNRRQLQLNAQTVILKLAIQIMVSPLVVIKKK